MCSHTERERRLSYKPVSVHCLLKLFAVFSTKRHKLRNRKVIGNRNMLQRDGLTQVIFVQFNILHNRGHDEGEGFPVEEVKRVANKHAEEDNYTVIAETCGPHGCA